MKRYSVFVFFMLLLTSVASASAEQSMPAIDTRQPLEIQSQQLEIFQQKKQSVFSGDVVAVQEDMTLTTDRLTVFFIDDNTVDYLEAVGSVKFTQLDRTATADKAVYRQADEVLTLLGDARVQQGKNVVSGEEIVFFVRENRSVVKSSSKQRVKAVIVQEEKKETP